MKYKALKDVPYWDIKAEEIYVDNLDGYLLTIRVTCKTKPLLEAGIIEEYKPREPLVQSNIEMRDPYIYFNNSPRALTARGKWDNISCDSNRNCAPIFRLDEEKIATDCYKAMCDFGFEWVKENYSKYH